MEKNVQKLDLEEIRLAREALNKELGITTPQPEYKKKKEVEPPSSNYEENSESKIDNNVETTQNTVETVAISTESIAENIVEENFNDSSVDDNTFNEQSFDLEEDDDEIDFSVYDNFAPFEVNKGPATVKVVKKIEPTPVVENSEPQVEQVAVQEEREMYKPTSLEDALSNINSIEDLLNMDLDGLNEELSGNFNEENNTETEEVEEVDETISESIQEDSQEEIQESEEDDEDEFAKELKNLLFNDNEFFDDEDIYGFGDENDEEYEDENHVEDDEQSSEDFEEFEQISEPQPISYDVDTVGSPVATSSYESSETSSNIGNSNVSNSTTESSQVVATSSVSNGFNNPYLEKQKTNSKVNSGINLKNTSLNVDRVSEQQKFENINEQPKENVHIVKIQTEEKPKVTDKTLKKIDNYNFIDIIKSTEFMGSDEMTCIYGIDENKNIVCHNFKDFYNVAVFSENDDEIFKLFSSIMMSLTLKNSNYIMKYVICDATNGSKFDVYNDLSYMFFSRVAKTNTEIIDSLTELKYEIDKRYENLAKAGVKNIEEFNEVMKKANIVPMPYTLLFFNNYSRAIHFDENNEINEKLSYILKYGRLVGMYVNLVMFNENVEDEINYNLQTRISFKADKKEESLGRLGESGAENIGYNDEYVCKTLFGDKLTHLKVPSITQREVEVLVKNIEI